MLRTICDSPENSLALGQLICIQVLVNGLTRIQCNSANIYPVCMCAHVCTWVCLCAHLSQGLRNNNCSCTRSQWLEKGKQILVPYPKPGCILKGRTGGHKQKKIIHSKHLEELNIPHQRTAKYCLMYTIKIIRFCR